MGTCTRACALILIKERKENEKTNKKIARARSVDEAES